MRSKVDEKLDELLVKDIIEEVLYKFIEWVLLLVVVLKVDGDIWICVDMCRVNMVIERERYFIFMFEEVLYDFNGLIVFLKFDLKWGFY